MSAHLATLQRLALAQGLRVECLASHGTKRYAVLRADDQWRHSPILWHRTLGEVQAALTVPA